MKKFSLMLDGTRFAYCKLDYSGERTGEIRAWSIRAGENSMLPREIFFLIQRRLRSAVAQKGTRWDAISEALRNVGEDFDCEVRVTEDSPTNVIWFKHKCPMVSFVLSDLSESEQFTALLNFRIDRTGFVHPRRTGVARDKARPLP